MVFSSVFHFPPKGNLMSLPDVQLLPTHFQALVRLLETPAAHFPDGFVANRCQRTGTGFADIVHAEWNSNKCWEKAKMLSESMLKFLQRAQIGTGLERLTSGKLRHHQPTLQSIVW
jgi:hypothetical protein